MSTTRPVPMVSDRSTVLAIAIAATGALGLGLIRFLASEDGEPQRVSGSVAFASPFAAIALVALLGLLRARPWLLAAAGAALTPMSLMVFNPIAFPMLVPGAFFIMRGLSNTEGWPATGLVAAFVAAGMAVAVLPLLTFSPEDPAEWQSSDGTFHGASDVITRGEVLITLSLSVGAVVVAWFGPPRAGLSAHPAD